MTDIIRILRITEDSVTTVRTIDRDDLHAYQHLVGGNIETVPGISYTAIANDAARLTGAPINPIATAITGQQLHGPVLFTGPTDPDGELTDCPTVLISTAHTLTREAHP